MFAHAARAERDLTQGRHLRDIIDRVAAGTLRDDDLIGMVPHYGEPNSTTTPIARSTLSERGFVPTRMTLATGRDLAPLVEARAIDPVQLMASILRDFQLEDASDGQLVLQGDHVRLASRG